MVTSDVAPTATITTPGPIEYNKGQHAQVAVQLNDVGKNIEFVAAVLYPVGNNQNAVATLGSRSWSEFVGYLEYVDFDWNWYDVYAYKTKAITDTDLINYRLPIYINPDIEVGDYELRIEVVDSKEAISLSAPLSVKLIVPATPPRLILTPPDYRIPAGQKYKVSYTLEHLDFLDRIELSQTGPVGETISEITTFSGTTSTESGQIELAIPESASEGQSFTFTATAYDINGGSKTVSAQIEVGLWGERTVEVTSAANADESMQFANVNVSNNAYFVHSDESIKFNNVNIGVGSNMVVSSKTLWVNDTLTVDGVVSAIIQDSYSHLPEYKYRGGQHGGNVSSNSGADNGGLAYGDYRNPKYPGSNDTTATFTGGELHINANAIVINTTGSVTADGFNFGTYGGGVLSLTTTSLHTDGIIKAVGINSGAGGSIRIKTNSLSGSAGYMSVVGGATGYAGGRIAIYYDTYEGLTASPWATLAMHASPGKLNSASGAGTIFLKQTDQAYGDLHIDNEGFTSIGTTSLETLGRSQIINVTPVIGSSERYKVTVEGKPWQLKNKYGWDTGVVGKQVSLNSADKAAPIFKVVGEALATDAINLDYADTLAPAGTAGSVKLYPLELTQDEVLYLDLDFQGNQGGKFFVFNDADNDGIVSTADLVIGSDVDSIYKPENPYTKISLNAGNYIVAVSRRFVSAGEAVLGISSSYQTCDNCSFSLNIKSVNTDSLIIQSNTPPVFTPGNDLVGVIRLDHLMVSPGSRLANAERIHSQTFDITVEAAIKNIPELISATPNVFGDLNISAMDKFYIGDVTANSLVVGDGTVLTVYGDLNITAGLKIESALPVAYGATAGPTYINSKNINIGGNIDLINTALEVKTDGVITATNISLTDSSITVPDANSVEKILYTLDIDISGKLDIDPQSSIDLTGKGYPARTGLDFIYSAYQSYVGHGGGPVTRYSTPYGPYGDYSNALFPGVGGENFGGGFARIKSNELLLNGVISVDGLNSNASGGGLNISTNIFNGAGRISAVGGRTPDNTSASGGRISIIAGIDNFTNQSGVYENSTGLLLSSYIMPSRYAGAGTTYVSSGVGQPGHLIVDNSINNIAQITEQATPLISIGRQTILNVEPLTNNQYRITVEGSPWQERINNPDGLGLKGLYVDLDADDEAGDLLEIISGTENTIVVISTTDITTAINQDLIGVITLDKISVLGGAILKTNDRLVLLSPEQSIIDSDSKLIAAQISELGLLGLVSLPNVGQLEFTDNVTATNLNISSGNFIFSGNLNLTTFGMTGGLLKVNNLSVNDALISNATIEAVSISAANNFELISDSRITVFPQSTSNDRSENIHHSLDINVAGILSLDINSSIDVSNEGYKYSGQERIGELSINKGDQYGWAWTYMYGCHGGTSIYAHQYFVNWATSSQYQRCEYGNYRHAQFAGTPGTSVGQNNLEGFGGGAVQIKAGTLNHFGKILANATLDYTSGTSSSSAGGGIHIETDNFSGNGIVEARGSDDEIDYESNDHSTGPGGRISIHVALSNTFSGVTDAGPGLHRAVPFLSGSAGTVYVQNPGEVDGSLIVDNYSRQIVTTTPEIDFPKTNIPSVGKHIIKGVENLGNNQWRIDTDINIFFQSYNDSVTATGPGSLKTYKFSLAQGQIIQGQMENLTSDFAITLYRDDGALDDSDFVYNEYWYHPEVSSKTFELYLPAGDYMLVVGGQGDARGYNWYGIDDVLAGENNPQNIYEGSYDLTVSSANDTWHSKLEKRLQGNVIEIEDSPLTNQQYKIYFNTESSIFVESTDDLTVAVGKAFIGVHNLQSLKIKGNSHVNFGGDRVVIADLTSSEFSPDAILEVGQIDQSSLDFILSTTASKLIITDDIYLDHLTLDGLNLEFKGNVYISNQVVLTNGALLKAKGIFANEISLDASTLDAQTIETINDINVTSSSTITISRLPYLYFDSGTRNIDMNVGGILNLQTLSKIDVSGKGPSEGLDGPDALFLTAGTCYGGNVNINSSHSKKCIYGNYLSVDFPGSSDLGKAGGNISITANEVRLFGEINSNASGPASGGGIEINTDLISGSGSVSANGDGHFTWASVGAGGRIYIHSRLEDSFTGSTTAYGGLSTSGNYTGAGTVFRKSPVYPNGYLIIDNNNNNGSANIGSTPVSNVGKHIITDAKRLSNNEIQIFTGEESSVNIKENGLLTNSLLVNDISSVGYHTFTLTKSRRIRLQIKSKDFDTAYYVLKNNNGVLEGVKSGRFDTIFSGVDKIDLTPGDYIVAVGSDSLSLNQAISRLKYGLYGTYEINISTVYDSTWKYENNKYGWGLKGLTVDLDANDGIDQAHTILTNTEESITLDNSTLDPLTLIGKELVGIHKFDRLAVKNGAAVDFDNEKVIINSPQPGDYADMVQLKLGGINDTAMQTLLTDISTGQVEVGSDVSFTDVDLSAVNLKVNGNVNVANNMVLADAASVNVSGNLNITGALATATGAFVSSPNIHAERLLIDGSTVKTSILTLDTNLSIYDTAITGTSLLTALAPTINPNVVYPLNITAGENVIIGDGAKIDVSGKGYPTDIYNNEFGIYFGNSGGPDFNYKRSSGCHAGKLSSPLSSRLCETYGRLEMAQFAGSAGKNYSGGINNGYGGGVISINAQSLNNEGTISANGHVGRYGGAGGSIHLDLTSLSGSGLMTTHGAAAAAPSSSTSVRRSGGGGRISMYLPDPLSNGYLMNNINSFGGAYSPTERIAGAGTVFLKYANEEFGRLFVNNNTNPAPVLSTPVRKVGARVITSVNSLGNNQYRLHINTDSSVHIEQTSEITESGTDSIQHHTFFLNEPRTVRIAIKEAFFDTYIRIFRDNAGVFEYIGSNNDSARGNQSRRYNLALQPGNYVVAVGLNYHLRADAIAGVRSVNNEKFGAYTITIDTQDDTWRPLDTNYGWGLDGLKISLEPTNPAADLYPIVSNMSESIIVESPIVDLTTVITPGVTQMIGVHEFESISVKGNAQVDFGDDVLIVKDVPGSIIEAGSAVTSNPNSIRP